MNQRCLYNQLKESLHHITWARKNLSSIQRRLDNEIFEEEPIILCESADLCSLDEAVFSLDNALLELIDFIEPLAACFESKKVI